VKILHIAPIEVLENHQSNYDSKSDIFKIGGLSKSVTKLAEAQSVNNQIVGVITTRKSIRSVSQNIYWDSLYKNSFFNLLFNDPFNKIENKFGLPDVINTHDIYEIKQIPFILHAIRRKIKVYITPRGTLSKIAISRNWIKKYLYIYLVLNLFIPFIEGFVALNQGEKNNIRNFYKKKKIIIIRNGIEDNHKYFVANKNIFDSKLDNKIINIGFVGRFEVYIKGLDILLESYIDYQKQVNDIRIVLTLIGEHSNKRYNSIKYFDTTKEKLIDKSKLRILKPLYNDAKWTAMSNFDIFIHPSRTEGMPNAVLEAMSIGIPCIVSPETNMETIVSNAKCGWTINNNKKHLLEKLIKIQDINKKELFEMGQNGMKYAQSNLAWEMVAKTIYK